LGPRGPSSPDSSVSSSAQTQQRSFRSNIVLSLSFLFFEKMTHLPKHSRLIALVFAPNYSFVRMVRVRLRFNDAISIYRGQP
jgi:hypothetical protein